MVSTPRPESRKYLGVLEVHNPLRKADNPHIINIMLTVKLLISSVRDTEKPAGSTFLGGASNSDERPYAATNNFLVGLFILAIG